MPINYQSFGNLPAPVKKDYAADPRLLQALQSMQQDSGPVQSWGEGLAKALSKMVGGYQAKQVKDEYQQLGDDYQKGLAKALATSQTGVPAWNNPDNPSEELIPAIPPGSDALIAGLGSSDSPYLKDAAVNAKLAAITKTDNTPSTVKEWKYYNSLPPAEQDRFLQMKRAQQVINLGGTQVVRGPSGGIAESYTVTPKPQDMPDFKSEVKSAEKTAELQATKEAQRPKAEAALSGLKQQAKLVIGTIDKALAASSGWSTGYGHYLAGLPNTEARKLDNYLNTIKANIGFDKLQQMRENSPTGGALGQVSDTENKLLQAVNGTLDPMQPDQLKEDLNQIKLLYPQVIAERERAFNQDYSASGDMSPAPPSTDPGLEAELRRRGLLK